MWVQDGWRSSHYPSGEWYTGFARDKVKGNPSQENFKMVEKDAQNSLSESIIVQIKGTSSVENTSSQTQSSKNLNEATAKNYKQAITTASNAVVAKMDTRSHFDKESGYIYGFAVVKKEDLANFYMSNINSLFAFADKEFVRLEMLAEQGKKNSAFGKIQVIEDSLKNVGYWGSLLQAVKSDNSYIKHEQDFWQKLNDAKKSLERGTNIYLDISGMENSEDFAEQLGAQMQEKNCNCTIAEMANEADYVVKIKAKLNRCAEENKFGEVYCFANANVSVNNSKFKKPLDVKIPEAKGGWTNGNKEKATEEAFKELKENLAEKIIQTIN